ncbi:hypothetical protein FRC06_006806 [Ceratobasidium sp. 370]|nr:hypothetical protein FRC06_006806 [Ceratobasidium sp. 370]
MSSQRRLTQTKVERGFKFTDPSSPSPRVLAPILIRRNTEDSPNPGVRTVDVQDRQLVGRAPPVAQFKLVTPPRSPIVPIQRKGSRVPLRSRSTTVVHAPPRAPVLATTASAGRISQRATTMIPVRKSMPGQRSSSVAPITPKRDALPRTWLSTPHDAGPAFDRRTTTPSRFLKRVVDVEHRRTASDPAPMSKSGIAEYPQLSVGKRTVLVSKLRMLLKCSYVDDQALDEWEMVPFAEEIETKSSGRPVFGISVEESIAYASCKVVLGEHTHYLPICVFASVEEICRRGVTTPALFRIAPSQNKRTLESLTHIYDMGPTYGQTHSLANQDISNVCALLKLYLRGLPEPIFSPSLWSVLCQITLGHGEPRTRIAAVQATFRLQARSGFSLLVYLLAFLHQLVLHGPQNGLSIPILAEMFGPPLFSPRTNTKSGGVVLSPKPQVPALVKTFRSAQDKVDGARVLGWILERWDNVAAGLLSLDVARDGEDVAEWGARFVVEQRRSSLDEDGSVESDSETVYSEGPPWNGKEDTEKREGFPFPEIVSVEQVPVRQVKDNIVFVDVPPPQSTRPSSPATLWSQETTFLGPDVEPAYVAELRRRMETQETELGALRRELNAIRDRFVFPFPPNESRAEVPAEAGAGTPNEATEEFNEDMMPTPRPPSGHRFADPPTPTSTATMRELVDSLQSEPPTPLFSRALRVEPPQLESQPIEHDDSDEILGATVFATTPMSDTSELPDRSFFVTNPDVDEGKKLHELYAARDALKSALAAMVPVEVQLRAVEEELLSRAR